MIFLSRGVAFFVVCGRGWLGLLFGSGLELKRLLTMPAARSFVVSVFDVNVSLTSLRDLEILIFAVGGLSRSRLAWLSVMS